MEMVTLILIICLIALIFATLTDLKTREVPDWLNFALIATGFAIHIIYSIYQNDVQILISGCIGFALCLAIGYLMFYTGQWGGGDSKMMMGLGAMLGLNWQLLIPLDISSMPFLVDLIINILFVGAIYGLLWSFALMIFRWKDFSKAYKRQAKKKAFKRTQKWCIGISIAIIIIGIFLPHSALKLSAFVIGMLVLITHYIVTSIKAIEESCMIKKVHPKELTEGDWIVDDIEIDGKYIVGPHDLGISIAQINKLVKAHKQKKIKNITIKEGIPFVPSFLVAFIVTWCCGSILVWFF